MGKFRVWAKSTDYLYMDIEADRKEDAMEKAKKAKVEDFELDSNRWEYGQVAELED